MLFGMFFPLKARFPGLESGVSLSIIEIYCSPSNRP